MEIFIIICLVLVLLVSWVLVRERLARLEWRIQKLTERLDALQYQAPPAPRVEEAQPVPIPSAPPPQPVAAPVEAVSPPPRPPEAPEPVEVAPTPAPRSVDWETLVGGNWLNKIGVFVLVVGIALALGYSFTQFGPFGRVSISVAASLAMLVAGAAVESRERYRIFARGLLGGGWAALYVTVYAMHAVPAARVIQSPAVAAFLLVTVAAGMIVHALRYRSQTVTGLAYFVAFGTLAITDMASLPFLALIPLAASLLYVAHRFEWSRMAALGLIATYAVVILRGDTGAPLWQAQSVFAIYWLLFEAYDVLHPEAWLLPLNAAGALGLSILKWQTAAPGKLWLLLAAAAAAYLVSAAPRIRTGKWQGSATLTAALAAAAIFQKLDHQWVATALVVEAELFYLSGIRLRAPFLRWLGASLFGLEVLRLLVVDTWVLPVDQWIPVATLDALVFYANRAIYTADFFYGYAGAAMVALLIGAKAQEPYRSVAWQGAAAGLFALGWWRRLLDFRAQGYLLLALGLTGTAAEMRVLPLSVAAGICYAGVLCGLWPEGDRLREGEPNLLRQSAGVAAVAALLALVWRLVPGEYLGVAWMALALPLLELGIRRWPDNFRRWSYVAAVIGVLRVCAFNLPGVHNSGAWPPRLALLWAALLSYALALRARRQEAIAWMAASSMGLAFAIVALWALLPVEMVGGAWALAALALLPAGNRWRHPVFVWQSCAAAALAYLFCMAILPDASHSLWMACVAILCFYACQLELPRGSRTRLYFSLLATTLTTYLLYHRISGSLLTVGCGIQGVILLASGFPLRDRVLRISGLVLLLACILKLFVWDLRHLDTLPRILSFIVLGVILMAVSWIYTRFREQVAKLL